MSTIRNQIESKPTNLLYYNTSVSVVLWINQKYVTKHKWLENDEIQTRRVTRIAVHNN